MREKDHLNKYYGLSKVYKQGPVNYHLDLVLQKNQFSFIISSKQPIPRGGEERNNFWIHKNVLPISILFNDCVMRLCLEISVWLRSSVARVGGWGSGGPPTRSALRVSTATNQPWDLGHVTWPLHSGFSPLPVCSVEGHFVPAMPMFQCPTTLQDSPEGKA